MTDETKPKNEPTEDKVRTFAEELNVAGGQLLNTIQDLVQKGNIRRLSIIDPQGRTLLEVPLTLGVVGGATVAIFAPWLAAIGAIAALVARVRIVVERYENPSDADAERSATGSTIVDVTGGNENRPEGQG